MNTQVRTFSSLNSYFLLIPGSPGVNSKFVIKGLRCNSSTGADRWLQCHAGTAIPADTAVPVFAPLLVPNAYISQDDFPDGRIVAAPGIVLVISSTRATLTKDVAATVDITCDIEEFEYPAIGSTVVGDTTTACKKLQVWAETAGPKRLLKVEAVNSTGADTYAQLFADDAPADGAVPLNRWTVPANAALVVDFGPNGGIVPYRQDADATKHQGGSVFFSSTQNTKTIVAANSGTIRATYKTA
jgi:hypothetical protein